jgi:hypothetical protein
VLALQGVLLVALTYVPDQIPDMIPVLLGFHSAAFNGGAQPMEAFK